METSQPGKILRLHFLEHDKFAGKPLYEAIVQKCRELNIAGATVFRGMEGYGESAHIHKAHLGGHHDQPIVITIVDTEENVRRLMPMVEDMMDKGLIALSDVEMLRIRKS